jgi:mono/diheme cytochrome c family protein
MPGRKTSSISPRVALSLSGIPENNTMMPKRVTSSRGALSVGLALLASVQFCFAASPKAATKMDFNRDIRPILSDNCFACHGPDDKTRKAKLRLDTKEDAFKAAKSGDFAIVPGDLKRSTLIERVTTKNEDDVMPPTKTGKKLTAAQIDLLKRWIAEGAPWQTHWAYEAPKRPALPAVKDKKWAKNEIDSFVLAKLEKEKLKPAPEADKTTLLRRASFDLTGLPPTPDEVDAFLADKSPAAYEKVVDRLLASPRYGEHAARYWLDAARYADSHGYHIDSERSLWKWREWVINAFNKNMPFDQFTTEQIAGDLLPEATVDQQIGSGYVRCNLSTGEGGAIVEEYQAKYTFDRIETTSTIWMGLTMTCARCHTHKYDPITHHEYYGLYALFNNLNESVMDNNAPNPAPTIKVPSPDQTRRQGELKTMLADGRKKLDAPMPELDTKQPAWEAQWRSKLSEGWTMLKPESVTSTNGTEFAINDDNSVLARGANPPKDVYEVKLKLAPGNLAAVRLEALPHESLPLKASGRAGDGNFRLSEFEAEIIYPGTNSKPVKIKFTQALADSARAGNEATLAIDAKPETGWQADTNGLTDAHAVLFLPAEPLAIKADATIKAALKFEASTSKRAIGHFRLSAAQNDELVQLLAPPKAEPWQVLGPFKTESTLAGFTNVFPPETAVDLKKTYVGVRDEIKWSAKPDFADGKANLLVQDLHGLHGAFYLHRTMTMPAPRKVEFSARADDLFKLWVNGKLVAERSVKEKAGEGPVKIAVNLKKGENKLLFKIVTTQGAAYFTFKDSIDDEHALPADVAAMFAATKNFNAPQKAKINSVYRRLHSPEFKEMFESVEKWTEENSGIERSIPSTMVAKEMDKRRDTFLLVRGEYDKKGDKVGPGVPAVLPPWPTGQPTNRLGFARWLLQPDHPLTARVTVNRFWQQYFGTGLVKTTEDFGVQGDNPSHPELLDWLATEFQSNWDMKKLHRLMVTSAAYRQSSKVTPQMLARDPENRLIARGPRFRVDAESVRDTALYIGGLLVERAGGKSVKPYQPGGLWEAVSFNNSQKYVPDTGDSQYRRSMYTYWKRQSPPPNMMIFDAPTREYCVVRRPRTNTPLQALALMNDPQIVEASRAFAQRMMTEGGKDAESRLAYGFSLATSRKIAKDESKVLLSVFKQQFADYQKNKDAAEKLLGLGSFKANPELDHAELAAWTMVANTILNLDETITKN